MNAIMDWLKLQVEIHGADVVFFAMCFAYLICVFVFGMLIYAGQTIADTIKKINA